MEAVVPEATSNKRSMGSKPNLVTIAGVITIVNRTANTSEDVSTNKGRRYL